MFFNESITKLITQITLIIALSTQIVLGCDCDLYYPSEMSIEKYADFDVIFIGSINQGSYINMDISNGETKVKVLRTFKGKLSKTETVNFDYFGAWGTRKGEKLLIFAKYDKKGNLYTNECAGSSKIYDRRIVFKMSESDKLYKEIAQITQKNVKFLNELSKLENGYVKFYFNNGKIMAEGEWENGFPIKSWKHYNQEGILKTEVTYNQKGKNNNSSKRYR